MGHGFKVEFKSGQNANLEQAETGRRLSCSPHPSWFHFAHHICPEKLKKKNILEIWVMLFRESENCCWRLRNRVMQIGTGQDWTSVVLLPKLISLCWAPHLFEPEPLQQILAQWHTAADLFAGFYITLCSPKTQYKPPDVLQYIWTYVGYEFKMLGLTFSVLCSCDPTDLADTFHFASLTTWPETLDTTIGMHNMGERPSTDSHKWT